MTSVTATRPPVSGVLRKDMSDLLVIQPMISMNALFMRHETMADGGPGDVAATNGRSVFIWPRYFGYVASDRLGILLHEYLHAAFAHPLRALKLRRRHGAAFRMDVLNVAADAIINKGIQNTIGRTTGSRRTGALTLPDGLVSLDTLVRQADAVVALTGVKVDTKRMASLETLTLEWLYATLMTLLDAANACMATAANDNGPKNAEKPADGGAPGDGKRERNEKEMGDFIAQFGQADDIILDELERLSQSDVDDGIRDAAEKLRNAVAMGKGQGNARASVIETLSGDIPHVGTPWETSFRSITQRHLARLPIRQPSRPGRRVLTQEAMASRKIVWSPARRRPHVPRVVVILDSSGSVQAEEYRRYLAEIQAMKRRTNAEVVAIVADTAVQGVFQIKDVKAVADVKFSGRGGTDFRPALALAEEMEADLVVYLTDLMGTFPDKAPPMPVIWTLTIPEVPTGYRPPFGRVIHVG